MKRNDFYYEDIQKVSAINYPWEELNNKSVLITGANGLIGSFFVDVIMYKNEHDNLQCHVIAVDKNEREAEKRFSIYRDSDCFEYICFDVAKPFTYPGEIHYMIHAASSTKPGDYTSNPIGIIDTGALGSYYLLQLAKEKKVAKYIFTSSIEVYGQNRGDTEFFTEPYCGYIDCTEVRSSYPETKRLGENLCKAFYVQGGVNTSVLRIPRTFGSAYLEGDTKITSLFFEDACKGRNIVLKSTGTQMFSYCYVGDVVSALFCVLFRGKEAEVYNVAAEDANMMLKDFAQSIADAAGTEVDFQLDENLQKQGYSNVTKALMSNDKIRNLGWEKQFCFADAVKNVLNILKM